MTPPEWRFNIMETSEAWDKLLDIGVSEETLQVVTSVNGYRLETLEQVLYAVAGYNDFNQLEAEA